MSKGALVHVDVTGLRTAIARLKGYSSKKVESAKKKATASLRRQLRAEAARQVSEHQLNLSARQISPYVNVKSSSTAAGDFVAVTASNERVPLRAFKPRFNKRTGVTVQTWRDAPVIRLPHAFARGRDAWQRIPATAGFESGPSGLVHRLPIVQRKGPSMRRTLQNTTKGGAHQRQKVVDNLSNFARKTLAAEIQRQLNLL